MRCGRLNPGADGPLRLRPAQRTVDLMGGLFNLPLSDADATILAAIDEARERLVLATAERAFSVCTRIGARRPSAF
jgi:hypothetical protein